jgi:hypothetical protein
MYMFFFDIYGGIQMAWRWGKATWWKVKTPFTTHHRRREGRPDFRRAAGNPWRFILADFGTGIMPFDLLHSSLREFLGPWVETRDDFTDEFAAESRSIASEKE